MSKATEKVDRRASRIPGRRNAGRTHLSWARIALGVWLLSFAVPLPSLALDASLGTGPFRAEDATTIGEIAAYPPEARRAALVAAGHPDRLFEIQKIQRKSADDFAALISDYPRETQEQIWNLVRYPDLSRALAAGGRKSNPDLERIAANYPEAERASIIAEGRERYQVWVQIYALDLEVEQSVYALLADLTTDERAAFDALTKDPQLASLLIDNMHMTTLLGAIYRDDPEGVEARLALLHDEAAAQRAADESAWAEEVADPEAAAELEQAARAFAEDYGFDLEADDPTTTRSEPATIVYVTNRVDVTPYPYWFGYPYWYDYAYWYPRPIWGHVGFYFGSGNGYVSIGLPSPYFLHWYHGDYGSRYYGSRHYGSKGHRRAHYYNKHRPHHSSGEHRHHASRARRVHNDSRRDHDVGHERIHSGSRRHQASREARRTTRASARREGTTTQRQDTRPGRRSVTDSSREARPRATRAAFTRRNEPNSRARTPRMARVTQNERGSARTSTRPKAVPSKSTETRKSENRRSRSKAARETRDTTRRSKNTKPSRARIARLEKRHSKSHIQKSSKRRSAGPHKARIARKSGPKRNARARSNGGGGGSGKAMSRRQGRGESRRR